MTYFVFFFIFLFGLIIGSFLNCLVWRIYNDESVNGRSYCPKCRQQIRWYDNIPVFSFILLRGKCRDCGARISWQYPVVELVTAILFVAAFYLNYESRIMNHEFATMFNIIEFIIHNSLFIIQLFFYWLIISVMIIIFIFDSRWYIIPDKITLPAIVITIIFQLAMDISIWQNLVISGIIGLGFFLTQFVISKGKWIGGGDLRLGLLMGVALGWPAILAAIMLSYLIGSLFAIYLLVTKKKELGGKLPLGTFLSVGTVAMLLWGEQIIAWYLDFIYF